MIEGYKCFNGDGTTNLGQKIESNVIYECSGDIKFGSNGCHMCTNLEDTLRYFNGFNEEVLIAKVCGYPPYQVYDDEYNGYYEMYVCKKIIVSKFLSRDEIISMTDNMPADRFNRFVSGYKLTKEEYDYFKNKYKNNSFVLNNLIYFYEDKDVYNKKYVTCKKLARVRND